MSTDLEQWDNATVTEGVTLEQMDQLIKDLRAKRDEYDDKKAIATAAYNELDEMETKVINALNANKRSKYEVEGVASVSISHKESYTTPKTLDSKQKLFDYIKSKYGPDALMGMVGINSATLNAWANKESEAGVMEIPGLEAPTATETLSLRRK